MDRRYEACQLSVPPLRWRPARQVQTSPEPWLLEHRRACNLDDGCPMHSETHEPSAPRPAPLSQGGDGHASPEMELSARQSALSFQRTRMSADRTLLSMLRTSISLVGFGFTISQFLGHLRQVPEFAHIVGHAGRNFGLALVLLGNALLAGALAQHVAFRRALRAERDLLVRQGLLHAGEPFASSLAVYAALLFLLLAVAVTLGMVFRAGPFG